MSRKLQFALVLCALWAYGWVLALPFQLDDFNIVRLAPQQLSFLSWRLFGGLGPPDPTLPNSYLFRPTHWVLLVLARALSGSQAQPLVFHALSLLLHALATWLVWRFLSALLRRGPALAGALFFAIHPAGAQAVSWVAAGGDQLVTCLALLGCLAALRLWRGTGRRPALLLGLALAGALLSKLPAVALIPLALAAAALAPARQSTRLWRVCLTVLPTLLVLALRWLYLGTPAPVYAAGSSFSPQALPHMLAMIPSLTTQLLVPWNLNPEATPMLPLLATWLTQPGLLKGGAPAAQTLLALVFGLFCLLALLRAPRSFSPRLLIIAISIAVLALPVLFVWTPDTWSRLSRATYLLVVPLALLVGSVVSALGRGPWRRGLVGLFLGFVFFMSFDALEHAARLELAAGRAVRRRLADVADVSQSVAPGTHLVVIDGKYDVAGLPGLGPSIVPAVRPPFTDTPLDLTQVPSEQELIFRAHLTSIRAPVQVLEWRSGHLAPRGPWLPALPATLPQLTNPKLGQGRTWELPRPVPGRAIAGVSLILVPGASGGLRLELSADGQKFVRQLNIVQHKQPRKLVVVLDEDLEFLLTARVHAIRLQATSSAQPLQSLVATAPVLLRQIPTLQLVSPAPESAISRAKDPVFRVGGVSQKSPLRLRLRFLVGEASHGLDCIFRADQVRRLGPALCELRPGPQILQSSDYPGLTWAAVPAQLKLLQRDFGISMVQVRWRVEALQTADLLAGHLDPLAISVGARSPWGLFLLTP